MTFAQFPLVHLPSAVGSEAHLLTIYNDGDVDSLGLFTSHAAARAALLAYVVERHDKTAEPLDLTTEDGITVAIEGHFRGFFNSYSIDAYLVEG